MRRDGKRISSACAALGVFMVVLATFLAAPWHPVPLLFAGLALIAVSHVLTPCQDQITRWWRSRISRSSFPDRT
jgi:hypothetical protein